MNPLRPSRRLAALSFAALAAASMSTVTAQDAASQEHPAVKAVARIRAEVARMRGLQYQADVKVGVKSPAEIRTMVLGDFEKEAPAEDMAKQEKVYKQLGLIPPEYDLRARMIDFLSEQIGGYYDPEKKELFLVDQTQGGAAQVPGAQEAMDEMVMAHELHHALQDQNYDLSRWMELLSSHDDRIQGYKSLVEGEAQLVGMTYLFKKMGRGDVDIAAFNRMQDMAMRFSPEAQKMRDVPPYLLENMMFPYTQGAEFVQAMQRKLGWERIGQAFNDPPMSTEQVLHPEKFLGAERDEPTELMLPGFEAVLGKDAEELHENTLGEFNVTLLLRARGASKAVAAKAAAGWDGDRFKGYQTKDGRTVIVWLSTWDSEQEAQEFEAAYRKVLPADRHLERRGSEVLLVDGANAQELAGVVRRGFAAVKVESRFVPLPGLTARPPREDFVQGEAALAPAAMAAPSNVLHLDAPGATLRLPEGFKLVDDPVQQLQQMGSACLEGPDGARARFLRLPLGLQQADEQLQALLAQGVPDVEVRSKDRTRVLGRDAMWLEFAGTLPHEKERALGRVLAMDLGSDVLALAVTVPEGKGDPQAIVEAIVSTLWVDGSPAAGAKRASFGPTSLEVPAEFVAGRASGPIVATLEHPRGAKIQVVKAQAQGDLAARAAALEAQLPLVLEDFRLRTSGITRRGGRPTHELEFEAAGRRTRQLTFDAAGARWTISCSAPADRFGEHLVTFGRALASFSVSGEAPAAPEQPEQPKPERKAY